MLHELTHAMLYSSEKHKFKLRDKAGTDLVSVIEEGFADLIPYLLGEHYQPLRTILNYLLSINFWSVSQLDYLAFIAMDRLVEATLYSPYYLPEIQYRLSYLRLHPYVDYLIVCDPMGNLPQLHQFPNVDKLTFTLSLANAWKGIDKNGNSHSNLKYPEAFKRFKRGVCGLPYITGEVEAEIKQVTSCIGIQEPCISKRFWQILALLIRTYLINNYWRKLPGRK